VLACRLGRDGAVGGRLPGRPVRISPEAGGEGAIGIGLRSLGEESGVRACVRSSRAAIGTISWRRHRRKPKALGAIAPFGVLIQPAADRRRSSRRTRHSTRAGARPVGCCVHSSAARVVRPYPRTFLRPGRWRDPVARTP